MTKILLHPQTATDVESYLAGQSHALLISGPIGAGKHFLARHISSKLLGLTEERLSTHPFLLNIKAESSSIGIEEIRQLHNFLKLKTAGQAAIRRIAIIEDAHQLTEEAQNSLLKALEEPPLDTVVIMTAISSKSILPTILSRAQQVTVKNPSLEQMRKHYQSKSESEINQAYKLSSGLVGLTDAILSSDRSHALFSNVELAKQLLQLPVYERLLKVEEIVKDKELLNGLLFALKQIASSTIMQTSQTAKNIDLKRWHRLQKEVHLAEKRLLNSTGPKLVLTDLVLHV